MCDDLSCGFERLLSLTKSRTGFGQVTEGGYGGSPVRHAASDLRHLGRDCYSRLARGFDQLGWSSSGWPSKLSSGHSLWSAVIDPLAVVCSILTVGLLLELITPLHKALTSAICSVTKAC